MEMLEKGIGFTDEVRINHWMISNYPEEVRQAFKNYEILNRAYKKGRAVPLQKLYKEKKGRALVISSGSSLNEILPKLKDWPGPVFCSSSHASTLVYHGRWPDYLMVADPNDAITPEFAIPNDDWKHTILATHPSGFSGYIKYWYNKTENEIDLFRIMDPRLEWYRMQLYYAYPWIESLIIPFLDATAAQISLASYLGYDPIYLIGCDYGGPRFAKSMYIKGEWVSDPIEAYETWADTGKSIWDDAIRTKEGFITTPSYLYTKKGPLLNIIMHFYQNRMERIYNLAPKNGSAVVELPYADFDEICETRQDPSGEYDKAKIMEDIYVYLAFANTYCVPLNNGLGPAIRNESIRGFDDLEERLNEVNRGLAVSKSYYTTLMKQTGMSLIEMADKHMCPDKGQEEALRNMDVDAIQGIDIKKYMIRARELKKEANERYAQTMELVKKAKE